MSPPLTYQTIRLSAYQTALAMTDSPPSPSPRPRGGQPHNTNALKHGFYSRHFRKRDLQDLDTYQFDGLTDEATLLRIFMRRVIEAAVKDSDTYNPLAVLRLICLGSATLTRMLKVHVEVFDPLSESDKLLDEVLADVQKDWPTF